VIRFRDTHCRPAPPPWLIGGQDLIQRQGRDATLWALGDPITLGPDGDWRPLGDGYEVCGPVEQTSDYERGMPWLTCVPVEDMHGRTWLAPRVLDAAGERVFRVAYGPDFLPALSPQQYRLLDIAKAARDAMAAGESGTQDVPMSTAARWAAELLCAAYHLSPESIAALEILDDLLIAAVIGAAIGLSVEAAT
jgi:hypothetical protein